MPRVSGDPISIISFHSNQGFSKVYSTKGSALDFVETVPTERELLEKFRDTIQGENPDIILGYNSDKFDFPYLKERAEKLDVKLKLGVDGSLVKFRTGKIKTASIKGRVHIDLYKVVRRHLQLNSHTMGHVYLELFREEKIDIPGEDVYTCWNSGGEQLERLFRYSFEDVKAITRIGERMLPMGIELARIVGQPLFEITRRGTGTQVKWFLMRKSHELGHILPNEFGKFERNVVVGMWRSR